VSQSDYQVIKKPEIRNKVAKSNLELTQHKYLDSQIRT